MALPEREGRRVVVTGLGAVTSIGTGKDAFWRALLDGRSGVSEVESFDTRDYPVHIGGEVKDFAPGRFIPEERIELYGRSSQLGIAATALALEDAGLSTERLSGVDSSVVMGTTMGESDIQESLVRTAVEDGYQSFRRSDVLRLPDSVIALNIARELELSSDCVVIPTACAAGNYAIGHGFDLIQMGRAEVVVAGGCDAFSKASYTGFARMLALAPEKCQPFDKNRQGIVIGEGAGIAILESLEHALARKANLYAEVLGYGLSCDAHHMTIPHVDGVAAVMEKALRAAGVSPDAVSAVNAHGTGTQMNDKTECLAIRRVFGERASRLPVNSIKSMLGHTMGAASALEAIACVMTIVDGKIPPTIHYQTPDEECPVDCVPNEARSLEAEILLNNSFAFGANNACTVFSKTARAA